MKYKELQSGQSIIETVVAIFILVMGITAALGLANYSFGAATNINKQIIGTGLAREGLEAVKNMRDTNWLKGTKSSDCYDFATGTQIASCYRDWQTAMYNIGTGGTTKSYILGSVASTNRYASVPPISASYATSSANPMWALIATSDPAYAFFTGFALSMDSNVNTGVPVSGNFYYPRYSGVDPLPQSDYYREITIQEDSTKDPYKAPSDIGPKLIVTSRVWWKDKKCPDSPIFDNAKQSCRVSLQMYLNNWRVY